MKIPEERFDTLQPGDACQCHEVMQQAILVTAKLHKIKAVTFRSTYKLVLYYNKYIDLCMKRNDKITTVLPISEFIRRLENTKPPNILGDQTYIIADHYVILGRNRIPFDHIHKLNAEILAIK